MARACKRAGLAKLPAMQDALVFRRYERNTPGELLHIDTKKLHCFDKPGHRVTGDRTQRTSRGGSQALHVAIDDHSRVGFSRLLADEKAISACTFLMAALRFYRLLGVRIEQVMTDNGSAYKSRRFAKLLRRLGYQAHSNPPIYASHQWQSGAIHPDFAPRMGLCFHLPKLGCACQRVSTLDAALQLPPPSLRHFTQPSSLAPRI